MTSALPSLMMCDYQVRGQVCPQLSLHPWVGRMELSSPDPLLARDHKAITLGAAWRKLHTRPSIICLLGILIPFFVIFVSVKGVL